jgi:hypothetical protein
MVFFSRVGNRVESSESFQEARIMSSAEVVGAPAGDTGGTAIEVAVGKRGRQPLTGAERCRRIAELGIDTKSSDVGRMGRA